MVARNALNAIFVRAVGLQHVSGVAEVLVGDKHGEGDAQSKSCNNEQHLQRRDNDVRFYQGKTMASSWRQMGGQVSCKWQVMERHCKTCNDKKNNVTQNI